MKPKKSLQKFTEKRNKVEWLFSLKKVTFSELDTLNKNEREQVFELLQEKINSLKGVEKENFIEQFIEIWDTSTKNQLWEYNQNKITYAISTLIQEYGRMPSKTEIADLTQLSRQTVYKHLKEYANHPQYLSQIEQFRFMTLKVLASVFQLAVNGDTGAAKLYFNVTGFMNNGQAPNNTLIQNQNNYIQINGTVLSQETVKHLNPEQLNIIETILKTALPQPLKSEFSE